MRVNRCDTPILADRSLSLRGKLSYLRELAQAETDRSVRGVSR